MQHIAVIDPLGDEEFQVTCPEGCNLGTSARQTSWADALKRMGLHQLATTPLWTRPPKV